MSTIRDQLELRDLSSCDFYFNGTKYVQYKSAIVYDYLGTCVADPTPTAPISYPIVEESCGETEVVDLVNGGLLIESYSDILLVYQWDCIAETFNLLSAIPAAIDIDVIAGNHIVVETISSCGEKTFVINGYKTEFDDTTCELVIIDPAGNEEGRVQLICQITSDNSTVEVTDQGDGIINIEVSHTDNSDCTVTLNDGTIVSKPVSYVSSDDTIDVDFDEDNCEVDIGLTINIGTSIFCLNGDPTANKIVWALNNKGEVSWTNLDNTEFVGDTSLYTTCCCL